MYEYNVHGTLEISLKCAYISCLSVAEAEQKTFNKSHIMYSGLHGVRKGW